MLLTKHSDYMRQQRKIYFQSVLSVHYLLNTEIMANVASIIKFLRLLLHFPHVFQHDK